MLNVTRLMLLAKVDAAGSITAAAQALNYTASAVSQQLLKLEKEVGQPLIRRLPNGVQLTEEGKTLVGHAHVVEQQLLAAEADLAEVAGLRRGRLAIGTFATVASSFVPMVIRRFKNRYPGIDLSLQSLKQDDLQARLSSGAVNISLLWDYEWNRVPPEQFELIPLIDDPTVLIVAADHRLASRTSVEMRELADEDWVERGRESRLSEVLERSANAAGFTPKLAVYANDSHEAQAMVSVGLGIGIAPLSAVINRRPDVRLLSLGDTAPRRRILAALRRQRVRASSEEAMLSEMIAAAAEYEQFVQNMQWGAGAGPAQGEPAA